MNKLVTVIGVLIIIVIGWFLLGNNSVSYVATVDDEVAQLEDELASLEAEIAAGTLSPEEAAKAQAKIVARIDVISGAASAGKKAKLTDAQRVQLIEGLDRLTDILTKYRATLVAIDEAVLELPEAERPKLRRSGGGRTGVAIIPAEAIDDADEQSEEIIEDITDEELAAEATASSTTEVEVSDETESEADETSEATASSSDEAMDETGDGESDGDNETAEDSGSEMSTTSDEVEIEADVEITATTTN